MYLLFISPQGTVKIELAKDDAFALNIQAKDFSVITEKSNMSFYSLGGAIAYVENKARLMQIADKNVSRPSGFVGRTVKCWIVSSGDNYIGDVTFTGVNTANGAISLNFTFIGGAANWIDSLPEYLYELDLGTTFIEHDGTFSTINSYAGAYDGSYEVWFSFKVYETLVRPNGGGFQYKLFETDLRPDLYFKSIIKGIESVAGLNLASQILSSDWFGRWLMPFTGTNGVNYHVTTLDTPPVLSTTNSFLSTGLWNEAFDPLNAHDAPFDRFLTFATWETGSDVIVRFDLDWDIATGVNPSVYIFNLNTLESIGSEDLIIGQNNVTIEGTVKAPAFLGVFIDGEVTTWNSASIKYRTHSPIGVIGANLVNTSSIRRELKTIDFITSLTEKLNLVWYYDLKSFRLVCESKWGATLPTGEVVDGFYKHSTFSEDYTPYLDCVNEATNYINSENKQIEYQFKEDEKDIYTEGEKTFGSTIDIKNTGKLLVKKDKVFAPTKNTPLPDLYVDTEPTITPAIIPILGTDIELIEDTDATQFFDFLPRILYKMGKIEWWINRIDTIDLSFLPLAAQRLSVVGSVDIIDIDTNSQVANLTWQDFAGVKGFFSLFYEPDLLIWQKGGRKPITINIPIALLLDLERTLRYKKHINFRGTGGGTYIIESYQIILNKKGLTSVSLIDLGVENI